MNATAFRSDRVCNLFGILRRVRSDARIDIDTSNRADTRRQHRPFGRSPGMAPHHQPIVQKAKMSQLGAPSDIYEADLTQVAVGWASDQGLREEMEDELAVVTEAASGLAYIAVFDGHAGSYAAKFLRDELYSECVRELQVSTLLDAQYDTSLSGPVSAALSRAFLQLDARLLAWQDLQSENDVKYAGSTATAVFLKRDSLIVANAGDCRAVLCSAGDAVDLCSDHRPFGDHPVARLEIERVKQAGGWVSKGRVCGYLAVSRAFGDILVKDHRKILLEDGLKRGKWTKRFMEKMRLDDAWVTANPDVALVPLTPEAEFVIVGSDGLWDNVTSSEVVRFVRSRLAAGEEVQDVCQALVRYAIDERKSDDNVSVVLARLK